ncbi:MAG: GAF domain-containing SpoIIE family protein phosphatase [Ignavibacteriaceae bacterium]
MNRTKNSERKIQEFLLLQRSSQKLNSILDLDVLLEEIVNDVAETFGYLRTGVLLKDDETDELEIAAVRGWTKNYHIKGDRFKIGVYGMIGHVAAIKKTYYAPDVTVDPYYKVSEESTRSEVDIPLMIKDSLIGVFSIQHHEKNAFDQERIELLETLASQIAIAIENARLFRGEKQERERISSELNEARKIQLHLFPHASPIVPGFNISGICLPCLEAGGDWFDYIPVEDGKTGIVLADVSGKGMGAALLMSSTRSILRLVANQNLAPGNVLKKVNELLINDFPTSKFVTMIYAVIDPVEKSISIANAGHLYPVIYRESKSELLETKSGLPLGINQYDYDDIKISLHKGDKLFFYTDGITEAMNKSEDEFGTERLLRVIEKNSATPDIIISTVQEFTSGNTQSDDITVVMIEAI